MKKSLTIAAAVLLLQACSQSCPSDDHETYDALVTELGKPTGSATIKVYDGMQLMEYQGGLYRFIRKGDTLSVTQARWKLGKTTFLAWRKQGSQKIIDRLCIPPDVQY